MTGQVYEKIEDLIIFSKIEPYTVLTEKEISELVEKKELQREKD